MSNPMPLDLDRIALALGRAALENLVLQQQLDAQQATATASGSAAELHEQRNRNRDETNAI